MITDAYSASIPWEYAATRPGAFWAGDQPMLRLLEGARPTPPPPDGPPHVLVLAADPLVDEAGQPITQALDIESESRAIEGVLRSSRRLLVGRRLPPTQQHLRAALVGGPAILHLSCHGTVIPTDAGMLALLQLEDIHGKAVPLRGD